MLDEQDIAATAPPAPTLRDEEGVLRQDFVEQVDRAIEAGDTGAVRALAVNLHHGDLGDLIEALEAERRPQLIELLGHDFDFAALTEVDDTIRDEILEELPNETVAEGVRELESDDAVTILQDLPKQDQEDILDHLPVPERLRISPLT